jgi:hypothetical protein
MTSIRRGATAAYRWLTIAFFVGVVLQFFLAGSGVFGIEPGTGLGDSSLDPHRDLGEGLMGMGFVLLLLVLIAWPTRFIRLHYVALFVLASVAQPLLADPGSALLGGLHGLNAVAILGLAGLLAHRAFRREVTAR